ncbi:MAG TPA: hypothetical protein DCY14_14230 [Anaerolineae bacterium]|nr:hypothetical protein [Anaerolineae bacterium]
MSSSSWKSSLHQMMQRLTSEQIEPIRVAVVGIGNEFRNDDAAGVLVARMLLQYENPGHALILRAGHAPENFTSELRAYRPHLVLMIDAADMGAAPGEVSLIPFDQIDGMTASTHSLPLSMLSRYLTLELNCAIVLIGIQAVSNDVGETVDPSVMMAVHDVAEAIFDVCMVGKSLGWV